MYWQKLDENGLKYVKQTKRKSDTFTSCHARKNKKSRNGKELINFMTTKMNETLLNTVQILKAG